MRWCGPEVEVEGIVCLKTGGCPEDCHFCSQSGLFASPVRSAWLDIPALVEAAKQTATTGATEFCIVAAVRGPDERLMAQVRAGVEAIRDAVDIQVACSLGMLTAGAGRRAARRWACTATTTTWRPRARYFPNVVTTHTLGGALGDAVDGPRRRHGGVLRRHPRHGRDASSSVPSSPPSSPSSTRTRCR